MDSKVGPYCLYGTSGAGKTRSVFEYLSHNKGFYFLSHDLKRNPGSGDLIYVMKEFGRGSASACGPTAGQLVKGENNNIIAKENFWKLRQWVWILLYIRHAVHDKLQVLLNRELTAREWLLCQLFPQELLGGDVFLEATCACVGIEFEAVEVSSINRYSEMNTFGWAVFVDEAQELLKQHKEFFLSGDGKTQRSAFSALVKTFCEKSDDGGSKFRFPVVSGTVLSLDELEEGASSITGKGLRVDGDSGSPLYYSEFKLLDTEAVQKYLKCFLNLSGIGSDVLDHVSKWLRGRPRWTASFLEVYICRTHKKNKSKLTRGVFQNPRDSKLIEALNCYLNVMTCDPHKHDLNSNRRETWSAGKASAFSAIQGLMQKEKRSTMTQRRI